MKIYRFSLCYVIRVLKKVTYKSTYKSNSIDVHVDKVFCPINPTVSQTPITWPYDIILYISSPHGSKNIRYNFFMYVS